MSTSTTEEFAEAHGLSLEEASLILSRRAQAVVSLTDENVRVTLARIALQQAHRKTGVAPVVVTPSGLEKSEVLDPEAEARFYADKLGGYHQTDEGRRPGPATGSFHTKPSRWSVLSAPVEDVSQDPGDYEP